MESDGGSKREVKRRRASLRHSPLAALALFSAAVLAAACSAGGSKGDRAPPVEVAPIEEPAPENPDSVTLPPVTNPDLLDPNANPDIGGEPPVEGGLVFEQPACAGGLTTTISGTVYIPSGEIPLYNVMVYVPRVPLAPLEHGVSCSCDVSGEPIVAAITDPSGHFVLENAPVGENIPLVMQVGKWRREVKLGAVSPCSETAVPDGFLRLPRRRGEGDMPRIAVSTGSADALECLVRKLGVDDSEFTNPEQGGTVNVFAGAGGAIRYEDNMNEGAFFVSSLGLWYDYNSLAQYDVVLLSCEGDPSPAAMLANKSPEALEAMFEYANVGGRIFASHYQSIWFKEGPRPFPSIATFSESPDPDVPDFDAAVVSTFPKGKALAEWLVNVGGSLTQGQLPIGGAKRTVDSENPAYAQRWIDGNVPEPSVQYLSANTPLGAAETEQCGRVVLSDIHVSGGGDGFTDTSRETVAFPGGCVTTEMTPQEMVLAFMLFDISACVIPDTRAPTAPTIR